MTDRVENLPQLISLWLRGERITYKGVVYIFPHGGAVLREELRLWITFAEKVLRDRS